MALPAELSQGIVSIYGGGSDYGISLIEVTSPNFYFGIIDQVSIYSSYSIYDAILFPEDSIKGKVIYSGWPYTLIDETKIILTELSL